MTTNFAVRGEYIQLDQLLKATGLCESGGAAHAATEPCQVSYHIQSAWDSGFVTRIEVHNHTDHPLDNWSVSWRFPDRAQVAISNSWNARLGQAGTLFTAQGLAWNHTIAPHGQLSFGFQVEHIGPPPALHALQIVADACAVPRAASPTSTDGMRIRSRGMTQT